MNGTGGGNTGRTGTGTETGTERSGHRGRHAGVNGEQARHARAGGQGKLGTVGGACATVPGVLQVGRCRLDSAPTTFATDETEVWRQHCRGCPRLTWIWESSRRQNSRMGSTPAGRPAIASSRQMRRADTAAASHSSTTRNQTSWWRRWRSLNPITLGPNFSTASTTKCSLER